ncbi:MAG: hypothetical protein LBK69_06950 [Syntrophomonadaceae bacterium]|jgi:hypothetical protein|nr:hypothetical protein [Syntrophomonadaceae bacterium]
MNKKNQGLFSSFKGSIFIILTLCLALLSAAACSTNSTAPVNSDPVEGSKAYNYFKNALPNENEFYIAFGMEGIAQNAAYRANAEVAVKGENVYVNYTAGDINFCSILKEGTLYMLNKRARTYARVPIENQMSLFSNALFDSERLNTLTYTSGEMEIGGVTYASEEYVDGASQVTYLFDESGSLTYIINNTNGNDIQMEILEFSGEVTDEMFNFPVDFTEDTSTSLEINP